MARRTEERKALLMREWPGVRPTSAIVADLNKLPGLHMNNQDVYAWANSLHLKRPFANGCGAPKDEDAIAKFIAEKGVTKCPAAAVGETTAVIPAADADAVRAHDDARAAAATAIVRDRVNRVAQARTAKASAASARLRAARSSNAS
jgi:hypothetical protein